LEEVHYETTVGVISDNLINIGRALANKIKTDTT
jgi:hypothetical protein